MDAPVSRTLNNAIIQATLANITVVVAAGNGDDQGYPQNACNYSPAVTAKDSAVITVGATDKNDNIASFSNYGNCVSLLAPGVNLVSISHKSVTGILSMSGTSFASPLVAGFAALIMSDNGAPMSAADVKSQIVGYATQNIVKGNLMDTPNVLLFGNLEAAKAGLNSSTTNPSLSTPSWLATGALTILSFTVLLFI